MRTHRMITDKNLRRWYALELWAMRHIRKSIPFAEFAAMSFGLESGVWAIQKGLRNDNKHIG